MLKLKPFFTFHLWLKRRWRDLRVFVHLIPWPVTILLLGGLLGIAALFWWEYNRVKPGGEDLTYVKAVVAVLNMTFFQLTYADMPPGGELDHFTLWVPLVGVPLFLAFGVKVIQIIRLLLFPSERDQSWQTALVQATTKNHIIICGLGRVGYRVAKKLLLDYGRQVVGIEEASSAFVEELIALDMPVILGDAENEEILKKAGIERAQTVLVCTNKDLVNLSTAFRARDLNRKARIVLRLFEDEMVTDIMTSFKVNTIISRSAVAALSFAYAAIGSEIIEVFNRETRMYALAKIPLSPTSPLLGRSIGEVAEEQDVTMVCYNCERSLIIEPAPETILRAGDNLFVFTTVEQLMSLVEYGVKHPASSPNHPGAILVCGLGHTGYRVVTNLLDLGRKVVALDFEAGRLSQRLDELGVPLKLGDLRWKSILIEAGVERAVAIVACTEDDMINLQITLHARALNPNIRVVMRIFDDKLGQQLRQTFNINAVYSTSALASPDFISAALNRMHVRMVDIGGVEQAIVRLEIRLSALYDISIEELHAEEGLTVLLHARDDHVTIPPAPGTRLRVKDEIVVLATETKLEELNRRNKTLREIQEEGYA